jgi:hypothetical protein
LLDRDDPDQAKSVRSKQIEIAISLQDRPAIVLIFAAKKLLWQNQPAGFHLKDTTT